MFGLGEAQYYVTLALTIAALALEVFAFVHALKTRPDAFVAAGKRTKNFWLAVTGVAMLLGFVSMGGLGLLAILGVVAAGVYLADVRPAVETVQGRGTGSHQGPYGPW
ncbi:hypothetical protein N798_00480 [Knoellia flava TL1]|uniref:DUF2516 domain-containing protein n=2 Tax=Knoellia flava TaxID=913969 RepID=A0A8H9KUE9_9MICO|nr:DUF2516 family protein [Knoellia flava]KGN35762.1 hypothetical protein N798_00480 [Knoellia flava TL1]GGB81009.1 hypothetical protein GCM10011314_20770 [Knoellia flava]